MAIQTAIEWTDATWNPVSGCTKLSAGCDNCYAERLAERFRGVPDHPFEKGFDLTLRPHKLREPLAWRRPRRVFVNSMSDLFHKNIPLPFVDQIFDTMEQAHWHVFQVLTKRSSLMRRYVNRRYAGGCAPGNIWLGVTVEDQRSMSRIRQLSDTAASVRFVSFEPLLEDLGSLNLRGIHWAIAGGESGPLARPVKAEWLRALRDQCRIADVAFFFKQWGGRTSKSGGNHLDGEQWLQYPDTAVA
jgi:protein gp37